MTSAFIDGERTNDDTTGIRIQGVVNVNKILMSLATALSLAVLAPGCKGPVLFSPGGALEGPEASLSEAKITDDGVIQLETRPRDPYSVNVGFVEIGGAIYIDPAPARARYAHIATDPQIRIRLEVTRTIDPATALAISDAKTLARFPAGRKVLKLVPR